MTAFNPSQSKLYLLLWHFRTVIGSAVNLQSPGSPLGSDFFFKVCFRSLAFLLLWFFLLRGFGAPY